MRLKRGSKVEVMNKRGDSVTWRMAEILSVNGHTYDVQYDCYPGNATQPMVERVTRKFLRPCPPLVEGLENCVAGSIVEVCNDRSWKIAVILKVLNGNKYLVSLLGCSQELIIYRSSSRILQTWHNDKWILMEKGSRGCDDDDGKASMLLASDYYQKMSFQAPEVNEMDKTQAQKYCAHIKSDIGVQESHLVSFRSLKRMSPYCSSVIEANNGHVPKIRTIEKEEMKNRVVDPIIEKIDAVAYPREILGGKHMHASFNNRSYGYNQMERPKQNDIYGYCGLRSSEFNNSDTDACSIGSCSVTSQSPNNYYSHVVPLPCQVTDTPCSDAESCYGPSSGSEGKMRRLPKEEVEARIHRLELHAYHCTLEALYAFGPLSWDKEALLTNLRIMLHISNDEHLMELKYLISTKRPQLEACFNCFQRLNDDIRVCRISLGTNDNSVFHFVTDLKTCGQSLAGCSPPLLWS